MNPGKFQVCRIRYGCKFCFIAVIPVRISLEDRVIQTGMEHDFRDPAACPEQQRPDAGTVNRPAGNDAAKMIRCAEAASFCLASCAFSEDMQAGPADLFSQIGRPRVQEVHGNGRDPHSRDPGTHTEVKDHIDDAGQYVHVLMAVRMGRHKPRLQELFELRLTFSPHF